MLAKRTELWRCAKDEWIEATRQSLYKGDVGDAALRNSAAEFRAFARRLDATPLANLEQGRIA
jgi:hypothetical protein